MLSWFYKFSTNSVFSSAAEQQICIMEKSKVPSAGVEGNGLLGFQWGVGSLLCGITRRTCAVCCHLKSGVNLDECKLAQHFRA